MSETISLNAVRYDIHTGLVPVIVQDCTTHVVLMLAYANREALKRTFGTGEAWFWSRSRQDYWRKGATSGNVQRVKEVRIDCDGDSVLYLVEPAGPACHTGQNSCFYRSLVYDAVPAGIDPLNEESSQIESQAVSSDVPTLVQAVVSDTSSRLEMPESSPSDEPWTEALEMVWDVVEDRHAERPQGSYTTFLFESGVDKMAKKVGEEGVEVAIAAKNAFTSRSGQTELVSESADLLFHLLVLWKAAGVSPACVADVLRERHQASK